MDEKYLEMYRETLNDAISAEDTEYERLIKESIQLMIHQDGEGVAVNFVLFTFYSTDRMSTKYIGKGFARPIEKDYFLRMLLIEQGLENMYAEINRTDLYLKAIDVYKSAVNQA